MALGLPAELGESAVQPDTISFNAAVSAREKGDHGGWHSACLLGWASADPADTSSFSAAFAACEKDAQWQLALGLPAEMGEPRST